MRCVLLLSVLAGAILFQSSFVASQAPTWAICPDAPTDIAVQTISLQLNGRNLSYVMTATVDEEMTTGSQIALAVNYAGAQIFTENIDMSQGTTLPIPANSTFTFKYGVVIPSIAPSGAYSVDLTFNDQNQVPLTCVAVNFNLSEKDLIAEY